MSLRSIPHPSRPVPSSMGRGRPAGPQRGVRADSTVGDLAVLDFSRVDQVCGPVFVEGAQPGDTLQVELLDFQPADWGWTAAIPGFGLMADEFSADRASRRHRPIRLGR